MVRIILLSASWSIFRLSIEDITCDHEGTHSAKIDGKKVELSHHDDWEDEELEYYDSRFEEMVKYGDLTEDEARLLTSISCYILSVLSEDLDCIAESVFHELVRLEYIKCSKMKTEDVFYISQSHVWKEEGHRRVDLRSSLNLMKLLDDL